MNKLGVGSSERARVLAAIVNFDRADLTVEAVRSLLSSGLPSGIDPIVIDNGSSAQDRARLEAGLASLAVPLVALDRNRGYAAAVNHAIDLANDGHFDAVWVMNNDLEFGPDVAALLLAALSSRPDVAAVAPVTLDALHPTTVLGAGVDVELTRGRVRHRGQGRPANELAAICYEANALEFACVMVRLEAAAEIGRLDEGFFMYWEDTEWSCRAGRAGWRLMVEPGARVWHGVAQSSPPAERLELMIRNRIRFVRMTADRPRQAVFMAYMLGAWVPAYLAFRLIPRLGPRKGLGLVARAVWWNVRDARGRGWDLRAGVHGADGGQ